MSAATDDCARRLRATLRSGPRPKGEIARAAHAAGFTDKQLRTARERLGVHSQRKGFGPGAEAWWSLPAGDEVQAPACVLTTEDNYAAVDNYDPELERALNWLDVELPPNSTRDTLELYRAAGEAGIGSDTLRRAIAILCP